MITLHDQQALQAVETVWDQVRYDSGVYACKVVRTVDGDGHLTVTLVGNVDHLLHSEPVKVDRLDVDRWRSRCVAVIGNPDLRVCGGRT